MNLHTRISFAASIAAALALAGCQSTTEPTTSSGPTRTIAPSSDNGKSTTVSAPKEQSPKTSELDSLLDAAKRGDLTAQGTVKPTTYFTTFDKNGRLWVFEEGSKPLEEFKASGEPAKSVTRPGGGPGGVTIRSADASTIDGYMSAIHAGKITAPTPPAATPDVVAASPVRTDVASDPKYTKPGFFAKVDKNGRLWVFAEGSKDLAEFIESGEPAKSVTRIAAGPDGKTIRSGDTATIDAYLALWPAKTPAAADKYAKEGFYTEVDKNGRLWVFMENSESLAEFKKSGEPAKQVVRPGAGPGGITIKSSDTATINAYLGIDPQK